MPEADTGPDEFQLLIPVTASVFTPGSSVNEKDLFAGSIEQLQKVSDTLSQRGYHAILFGERGVGKTSLANVISGVAGIGGQRVIIAKVTCDASDSFTSLWRKAFEEITLTG